MSCSGVQYTRASPRPNYVAIRDSLAENRCRGKHLYVRRYDAMRFIAAKTSNLQLMASDQFPSQRSRLPCMANMSRCDDRQPLRQAPAPIQN